MLGRYHFVSGRVVQGQQRGKDLGFPTANISARTEVLPRGRDLCHDFHLGMRVLPSVSSVGLNPTFGAGPRTRGKFHSGFRRNIYGEAVRLSFVKRIREEVKFSSVTELVSQVRADVRAPEAIFRDLGIQPGTSILFRSMNRMQHPAIVDCRSLGRNTARLVPGRSFQTG